MTTTRISVLLPLPFPGPFDYAVPEGTYVEPGNVVRVPLGPRTALGVVWDRDETASEVDEAKLKAITQVLSARPIPDFHRKFVDWVARYTLSAPGAVLRMTLSAPDGLLPPTAGSGSHQTRARHRATEQHPPAPKYSPCSVTARKARCADRQRSSAAAFHPQYSTA